ncbi:MAG: hypothetical protein K2X55_29700 [Burkholderiaceae bacterium]|nr:hypothetical protein [Burkholderiaceae bacterium]
MEPALSSPAIHAHRAPDPAPSDEPDMAPQPGLPHHHPEPPVPQDEPVPDHNPS